MFHRWDDDKHKEFLEQIGKVVSKSRIHPVCYGLYYKDFFSFSLPERKFLTGGSWDSENRRFLTTGSPNKPYFVAFTECIKTVASHTPPAGRVHLFFGCDRPIAEYAATLLRWLKFRTSQKRAAGLRVQSRFSTDKFGGIYFPSAKETPNLQVADLFSYLTYVHMIERRESGDWVSPPKELTQALLCNRKDAYDTTYRNDQFMRDIIAVVPNLPKE
jgi:hypothetical protein